LQDFINVNDGIARATDKRNDNTTCEHGTYVGLVLPMRGRIGHEYACAKCDMGYTTYRSTVVGSYKIAYEAHGEGNLVVCKYMVVGSDIKKDLNLISLSERMPDYQTGLKVYNDTVKLTERDIND